MKKSLDMTGSVSLVTLICLSSVVESLQQQRLIANFETFASLKKSWLERPDIADVGIRCSVDGITAQFQFYSPFNGRIYSANFQHDKSCTYYDEYGERHMLFLVPTFHCGTRSWRNSENKIVHLENEIYVQLDKYRKSRDDRRYIFVCKEKPPERHEQKLQWKMKEDRVHNLQGEQTVLVQTVSIPRMTIKGHGILERQKYPVDVFVLEGKGLNGKRVQRTVNLGDPITLVVKGPRLSEDKFQMFVHSCYAHDNHGDSRVDLIDKTGKTPCDLPLTKLLSWYITVEVEGCQNTAARVRCQQQPTITGPMMRSSDDRSIAYYVTFGAFRFPHTENVSFVCSVEFCESCNFTEPCHPNRGPEKLANDQENGAR